MSKVIPSVPINEDDFQFPDHWGHAWWSPSHEWSLTMSTTVENGWMLYGLIRAFKPIYCVETGTHKGLSALFVGAALRDNGYGHLITLDIENHGQIQKIIDKGLDAWVTCLITRSVDFKPLDSVGFLFLDAAHGYEAVQEELSHFQPYLLHGSIIAIDDSRLNPDEQTAAREFMEAYNSNGFQLLTSRGLYLIKYGKGLEIHDEERVEWFRGLKNFLLR